jgi:hypothetical protein
MKALVPFLLMFIPVCAIAQNAGGKDNKYKLALPDQWMGNRSMLTHLIAIAPSVFPKLEGKQFCLDCKTTYTLMFFYDSVVIGGSTAVPLTSTTEIRGGARTTMSNYDCVTTFYFKGTWVLMNKDSAIAELELVSPGEELTARKKFSLQRDIMVSNHDGKAPRLAPNPGDNPFAYINSNRDFFTPTVGDILAILAERVRKIKSE